MDAKSTTRTPRPASQPGETAPQAGQTPSQLFENQARAIEETFAGAILASGLTKSYAKVFDSNAFKVYRDRYLKAAGDPKDPVEIMLLEEIMWAHFSIGCLYSSVALLDEPEKIGMLTSASARLMAEVRRTSLALREYRSPVTPKQVTVVEQQNIAGGDQQVALMHGTSAESVPEKTTPDTELTSKPEKALSYEPPAVQFIPESAEGRCGQKEPVEAPPAKCRRPRKIAAVGEETPTMDVFDWSTDT
jgi:hypothetical protein